LPQYKFYFIEDDEKTGIISQKHFRLDFSVFLKDYKTNNILKKICIECDGYHFHSEKERMIRDNQRTRKLLNEGNFQTIRYLSDEIYENFDVKSLLDILLDEKYKEFDYNTKFKG
jgi:very-short-patch-repair endonuclease